MAKNDRKNGARGKRLKTAGIGVFLLLMVIWAASPLRIRVKQEAELASLSRKHQQIRRENRQLRSEIAKLKNDEGYWEKLARQNLGYVKSDEEAYVVFEKDPRPVKRKKPPPDPGFWDRVRSSVKGLTLPF